MSGSSDETTVNQDSQQNGQNHKADGGEKGQKGGQKGGPVGFWDKELNAVRTEIFKKWAITTLVLSVFILAVLSLYWAALFRVPNHLSSLIVWVVDFDGQVDPYMGVTPIIGPQIVSAGLAMNAPIGALGWINMSPADFGNDPMEVRRRIYNQKAWAAIIINPNATALLQDAVQNGNKSYDPRGALQTVYVQARDENTVGNYVTPMLMKFQSMVTSQFAQMWAGQVLANASHPNVLANIQAAPQAVSPAIGFSEYNLRPFYPPVTTPAISIGLIYLIIISFFSFAFYLPIHMKFIMSPGHRPLHFYQLIIWRWIATIVAYFFLSLFYSLISLAFQIPFDTGAKPETMVANSATAYGKGSFPVYWMVNYVGMIALGLACENVGMIVGQPWTAFWLIFWVITNVLTSFYSIDLAPHFYYWGYAWPLHNIVEASRTILFDIHSRIGLNFGVLFAWVAVNTALFPLCCYFLKWKTIRQKKKEAQQKNQ